MLNAGLNAARWREEGEVDAQQRRDEWRFRERV